MKRTILTLLIVTSLLTFIGCENANKVKNNNENNAVVVNQEDVENIQEKNNITETEETIEEIDDLEETQEVDTEDTSGGENEEDTSKKDATEKVETPQTTEKVEEKKEEVKETPKKEEPKEEPKEETPKQEEVSKEEPPKEEQPKEEQPKEEDPKEEPKQEVTRESGYRPDLLNEWYSAFHETADTFTVYNGIKKSEFDGYLNAVASGQMSKSSCVSKIANIQSWTENIALPYETEIKEREISIGVIDGNHVIVYETTEENGGEIAGYMYQNGLLTTGDYYQCQIYYDANKKVNRVALIGIVLMYTTYE